MGLILKADAFPARDRGAPLDEVYKREKLPRLGAGSREVVNYEEYAMRWSRKSEKRQLGRVRKQPWGTIRRGVLSGGPRLLVHCRASRV